MSDTAKHIINRAEAHHSDTDVSLAVRIRRFPVGQVLGPCLIFAVMLLIVAALNPSLLSPLGVSIITSSAATIMLLALGQAMVLNIGSIDLSNAAISVFGSVLLALFLPSLGVGSLIVIPFIAAGFGAINGAFVAYAQVPSLVLTLGTLSIYIAAAFAASGFGTIYVSENRELITFFFQYRLAAAPLSFWIAALVAVLLWLLLRFTGVGQGMTAVGKNEPAAIFSAIRTRRLKVLAFALSGFTAGLASIAIVAESGSASATGIGSDLLLPAIAAALVGGTSISGGVTNPVNVFFGALTVAFIPIAVVAVGIPVEAQRLVYGLIIIVVAALTLTRSRDMVVK